MESWEEAILIQQESEKDECTTCQYKGKKCKNQCMEIKISGGKACINIMYRQ